MMKVRLSKSGSRDIVTTLNKNLLEKYLKEGYEVTESTPVNVSTVRLP